MIIISDLISSSPGNLTRFWAKPITNCKRNETSIILKGTIIGMIYEEYHSIKILKHTEFKTKITEGFVGLGNVK